MAAWTLVKAKDLLKVWLDCEKAIALNQSITIGEKTFTKTNAAHIRKQVTYWKAQVESLELSQTTNKKPRRGPSIKRVSFIDG
mgnify:CR=1 FL=1